MDVPEMRRLCLESRVARMSTLGPDGRPGLVPIVFALNGDVLYTAVDHKPKRTRALARLRNIARDERVTVLVDHYDEDWSALWWVRLDGRARVVEDVEEVARAAALLTERYEQYEANPIEGPVIAISIERWTGWAATP